MSKTTLNLVRPFGPSVLKAKIPADIIVKLNNYIDGIIIDDEKSKNLNHGNKLVGDVTNEFKLENEILDSSGWKNFLQTCVKEWMSVELKETVTVFNILESWVVRQFKNEYNPTHWHSGHISGAGFLKLPETFGSYKQEKDQFYMGGRLQLIHGARMFLSPSTLNIKPEVGDFYFFPHYLMHTVFPFKGSDEERRSISFNARIDEKIFNVYGG